MIDIHIDFETFSPADLKNCGVWAYSIHPHTRVLMMGWAIGDDPPEIWMPEGPVPEWVHKYIFKKYGEPENFRLYAWNDFFEYCIMKNVLNWPVPAIRNWEDVAAKAAILALPRTLAECGKALGLPPSKLKSVDGTALVRFFSMPKKSKTSDYGTRRLPEDHPDKFEEFKKYCLQDVTSEREIHRMLKPLREEQRRVWELDRKINLRGVNFDIGSVEDAVFLKDLNKKRLSEMAESLSGGRVKSLDSPVQVMKYLQFKGLQVTSADKGVLQELLNVNDGSISEDIKEVICLRLAYAKSSLAKYDKLLEICPEESRAYGLLRFHGASTGRWSGNLFQPQNLPRPVIDNLEVCKKAINTRDLRVLDMLYTDVGEALSSAIRSMVTAPKGHKLIVSDFSQIESRVLAWYVKDENKLNAYRHGTDVYILNAVDVFGVHYQDVTSEQRAVGKVLELGCGYQGGVNAFQRFAKNQGLTWDDEAVRNFVQKWRNANPGIVNFWVSAQNAAIKAALNPGAVINCGYVEYYSAGEEDVSFLLCRLPSGRCLAYHRPEVSVDIYGRPKLEYWGVGAVSRKYERMDTYGGKLVENIVQATACDIMVDKMLRLDEAEFPIVFTVHDEIISEVPEDKADLNKFNSIMELPVEWCKNLPLKASGYVSESYRK